VSALANLLKSTGPIAKAANSANQQPAAEPIAPGISTISSPPSRNIDFAVRAGAVVSRQEDRSMRVQRILDQAPESVRYAYLTDDTAYPDFVVLVMAIRGVGTCELSIPREQYDAFKLLEIIG
jgi:hypothetical protein